MLRLSLSPTVDTTCRRELLEDASDSRCALGGVLSFSGDLSSAPGATHHAFAVHLGIDVLGGGKDSASARLPVLNREQWRPAIRCV